MTFMSFRPIIFPFFREALHSVIALSLNCVEIKAVEGDIKVAQTIFSLREWYFVTKIVLTYCEKKLF